MRKRLKLYKLLNNSGSSSNASGDSSEKGVAFFFVIIGILIAGLLGFLSFKYAEFIAVFGGIQSLMNLMGLLASVLILGFGLVNLINSMYMSSNMEILITLPFTATQLAIMKVLSFYRIAALIGAIFVIVPCAGYSIAINADAANWIAFLLEGLLLPPFMICVVAIIVVLLMSFLKIFRNRQTLRFIGMFLLFLILCLYLFATGNDAVSNISGILQTSTEIAGGIKFVVPVVGFLSTFAGNGSVLYLAAAVVVTLLAMVLFYLVTKALYLKGTLNMQDGKGGKLLKDSDLDKYCAKKSGFKALVRKEYRLVRRNPAFTLNNFIIGILWPVLVLIAFKSLIPQVTSMLEGSGEFSKYLGWNLDAFAFISGILSLASLMMALIPMISQTLAYSSLTREGKDFPIMKQIPVSYREQLKAKKAMAHRFAHFSITGYMIIFMIFASIMFSIPIVYCILPLIVVSVFTSLCVNSDMYFGVTGADVNWENEKESAQKKTAAVLMDLFYWAVGMGLGVFITVMGLSVKWCLAAEAAFVLVCVIAAILFSKAIYVKGEKKIRKMRF